MPKVGFVLPKPLLPLPLLPVHARDGVRGGGGDVRDVVLVLIVALLAAMLGLLAAMLGIGDAVVAFPATTGVVSCGAVRQGSHVRRTQVRPRRRAYRVTEASERLAEATHAPDQVLSLRHRCVESANGCFEVRSHHLRWFAARCEAMRGLDPRGGALRLLCLQK
jgi:hypothetical protein